MNTRPIYLALYKGHRDGSGWRVWCARATDWLTRILTRGQYSHAEIAVRLPENDVADAAQYECYSASIRDGGVRLKTMPLPGNKWDLIDLSTDPLLAARLFTVWQFTGRVFPVWPARCRSGGRCVCPVSSAPRLPSQAPPRRWPLVGA